MKEKIDWDLAGWILRSPNRVKVLKLFEIPLTPNIISKKANMSLTHASKIVRELAVKKLLVCLNEKAKLGRIYKRTKQGNQLIDYIKKIT